MCLPEPSFVSEPTEQRSLVTLRALLRYLRWQNSALAVEIARSTAANTRADSDESEAGLCDSFQETGIGTFTLDLDTERNAQFNQAYCDLFGFRPGEPVSFDGWAKRVHPEDREAAVQAHRTPLLAGESFWITYRVMLPDGVRSVESAGVVMLDSDGRSATLTGVVRAVSGLEQAA